AGRAGVLRRAGLRRGALAARLDAGAGHCGRSPLARRGGARDPAWRAARRCAGARRRGIAGRCRGHGRARLRLAARAASGGSVATAFANPGLAYPFVLPCLAAGACGLAASAQARWVASLLPLGVAAVLWCPVAWLLYDALGISILPASSALLALVLGTAAPAW